MKYKKIWCLFITLDVKNVFNTARWSIITNNVKKFGISKYLINVIENYFFGKTVEVRRGSIIGFQPGFFQHLNFEELQHGSLNRRSRVAC